MSLDLMGDYFFSFTDTGGHLGHFRLIKSLSFFCNTRPEGFKTQLVGGTRDAHFSECKKQLEFISVTMDEPLQCISLFMNTYIVALTRFHLSRGLNVAEILLLR